MERREEEQKAGIGDWIPMAAGAAELLGQPEIAMGLEGVNFLYNTFHHSSKQRNFHGNHPRH
jgi:hypothetical protein